MKVNSRQNREKLKKNKSHNDTIFKELKEKKSLLDLGRNKTNLQWFGFNHRKDSIREKKQNGSRVKRKSTLNKSTNGSQRQNMLNNFDKDFPKRQCQKVKIFSSQQHKKKIKSGKCEDIKFEQYKKNSDLFLQFELVNQKGIIKENNKNIPKTIEKVRKLIKKYKQKNNKIKTEGYSIHSFIEEDIRNLKIRKTEMSLKIIQRSKASSFCESKGIDIRQQNIHKVKTFLKGNEEEQKFSDYVCLRNIQKQRKKSKLYNRIFSKIGLELKGIKMDSKEMKKQSVKNVIYINDNIKIQGNNQRKNQIKSAMKNLKIIY